MTNLAQIKVPENIHSNINETYDFIDANLPKNYARDVQNLLPEDGKVSFDYIRRVKLFRIKNAPIMIALYRVAQWNLLQKQTN